MTKHLELLLILAWSGSGASGQDAVREPYLQVGTTCVSARDPATCMKSYGFECARSRTPDRSRDALILSCNLDLGDGRAHFVQMGYAGDEWTVETEETYEPELDEVRTPEEHAGLALSQHLQQRLRGFDIHSSATGSDTFGNEQARVTGMLRADGRIVVRAACGVISGDGPAETVSAETRASCEAGLLRTIVIFSQPETAGPYRVAAPSEILWDSGAATLVSGDRAFIVDGRYSFSEGHTPCRLVSNCCSTDGALYLQSCRTPTEKELRVIDDCLAAGNDRHSAEYMTCLRKAGVRVGCEEQDDGSRICDQVQVTR